MLRLITIVFFLPQIALAETDMTKDQALLLWVMSDWARQNCPAPAVPPLAALLANTVERSAPRAELERAREDYTGPFLSTYENVEDACAEVRTMDQVK